MSPSSPWSTPASLAEQVERFWAEGRLLAARLTGEALFPLSLRLRKPDSRALAERFDDVRRWIRELVAGGKPARGFGYELEWTTINHRQLGPNRVPGGAVIPTEGDALRLLGRTRAAEQFSKLADITAHVAPWLHGFVVEKPLVVLEHAAEWERLVAVVAWFRDHPRPRVYARQLEIPGVDTKLIEAHRGLLCELLDRALPAEAVDRSYSGAREFEQRYGLLTKPVRIRFRLLDERSHRGGWSDLSVPVDQLAHAAPAGRRVFLTENEVNGLAFPDVSDALVIFGLGYGLERLRALEWLGGREVYYWGDIDTHGFAILDKMRAIIPHAQSFLMDRETLLAHRAVWGREGDAERHDGPLARLDEAEQTLFRDLVEDRIAPRLRLEQERVAFAWLKGALRNRVSL